MTRQKPPRHRGKGGRFVKQASVGGYVVCGHCHNVMVGDRVTHCTGCRRGDMLTREDWDTGMFKHRKAPKR